MPIPTTPQPGPRWLKSYDFIEARTEPSWNPKRRLRHLIAGCTDRKVSDAVGEWNECVKCGHAHDHQRTGPLPRPNRLGHA